MNDFLSIREFAQLMGVSVHQVRYFEEKGLLLPAHIEQNGYRRYGVSEMYRLSHILLLRQLEIPVSQAGVAIEQYDAPAHEQLLRQSLSHIREEIERLQRLERLTGQILDGRSEMTSKAGLGYQMIHREKRFLTEWMKLGEKAEPTARMLFQAPQRPQALFEAEVYHIHDQTGTTLYFDRADAASPDQPVGRILPEGQYLWECFEASQEDEIGRRIKAMSQHAHAELGVEASCFILTEKSYLSLFGGDGLSLELEMYVGNIPNKGSGYDEKNNKTAAAGDPASNFGAARPRCLDPDWADLPV